MADEKIVAIDFGTCNSYISHISDSGHAEELKLTEGGSFKSPGYQTIVLYCDAGRSKGQSLFGQEALEHYAGATDQEIEEEKMRLRLNFKPDIGYSEEARQHSVEFLHNLLELAKKHSLANKIIPSEKNNVQVIIGIPSEASRDGNSRTKGAFSEALIKIAEQAGWGKVRLLDEPFGPLFYEYKDTKFQIARKHILKDTFLVIDFGGGTCDFSILRDGKIKQSWGDMCLGGRLFDDLFYQWTLDIVDDPDYNENKHLKNTKSYYYRDVLCRMLKEDFSNYMNEHQLEPFQFNTRQRLYCYKESRVTFTWEEFIRRARHYKPSESFCKNYKDVLKVNPQLTDFNMGEEFDLLDWFERVLNKGLRDSGVNPSEIDQVLLAGGSSVWFFVKEACAKLFSEEKICRCNDIFAAIASGLAFYTNIKKKAENAMRKLKTSKNDLIRNLSKETIDKLKITKSSTMLPNLGKKLFEALAVPALKKFSTNGGKMVELEQQMNDFISKNSFAVERCISGEMLDVIKQVNMNAREKVKKWFEENGVPENEFNVQEVKLPIFQMDQTGVTPFNWGTKFLEYGFGFLITTAVSAAIIGVLYAVGATAIVQPWLWPWLIGGGIIVILTGVITGTMSIKDAVEKISMPPFIAAWLITDKKIDELRKQFVEKFSETFPEMYNSVIDNQRSQIEKCIEDFVNNELNEYNKILEMESEVVPD